MRDGCKALNQKVVILLYQLSQWLGRSKLKPPRAIDDIKKNEFPIQSPNVIVSTPSRSCFRTRSFLRPTGPEPAEGSSEDHRDEADHDAGHRLVLRPLPPDAPDARKDAEGRGRTRKDAEGREGDGGFTAFDVSPRKQ